MTTATKTACSPEIVANGVRFNVVRMGSETAEADRPTVVCVHGLIMDNLSSFYYTFAPGVSADADVVLYDLRGHGRSERPSVGYAMEDAVADLEGLLDELGVAGPVYLVGNSYGGTVALSMALERPERVAGIVLIEGHPIVENWGDELMQNMEQIVSDMDNPGVREWIVGSGRKMVRMAETCEQLVTSSSLPDDLRRAKATTPEEFAAITCPVLCLYGEQSPLLERGRSMEAQLPNCDFRIVEGCTHSILMEAPEELEEHICSWLADQVELNAGVEGRFDRDLVSADSGRGRL
jgi:pimeloyl-ACP methyl ester carboxylesterase